MAKYVHKNAKTISRAFARFRTDSDAIIREGMIRLAKAGLQYLIEYHDMHAAMMHHTTENDTMAWAVAFNGSIVASGSHNGGDDDMHGHARESAERELAGTSGWVAIILSDMEGWYRVDYEENFIVDASSQTATDFQTYFQRIR